MNNIKIDDYYISISGGKQPLINVIIDGQMICQDVFYSEPTKSNISRKAIQLIDAYNKRHGCSWG